MCIYTYIYIWPIRYTYITIVCFIRKPNYLRYTATTTKPHGRGKGGVGQKVPPIVYRPLPLPQGRGEGDTEDHRSSPNIFRLLGFPIGERNGRCRTDSFGRRNIHRILRQAQGSQGGGTENHYSLPNIFRLLGFPIGERNRWCRTNSFGGMDIYRILRQAQGSRGGHRELSLSTFI